MKHVKKFEMATTHKIGKGEKSFEIEIATKAEQGLRTKIDKAILGFVQYETKIDLEFMKTKLLLSGDDQYNEIYKDILDVLNKHKRFKNI